MDDLAAIRDRFARRSQRFDDLAAGVAPERWSWPSPCDDWDARGVVAHVIDMHAVMLRGPGGELPSKPTVADDPVGALQAARRQVEALLEDPIVAASEVPTPTGPQRVADHVDGVVSADLVIHGWDLARATGQDDAIDPEELDALWPAVRDIPDEMRIPEHFGPGVVVFGPEVPVAPDASVQDRVLGAMGRDPRFRPGPEASAPQGG